MTLEEKIAAMLAEANEVTEDEEGGQLNEHYNARVWTKDGEIHRDGDKPAMVYTNGSKHWYKHGKLHRDGDKPAIVHDKDFPEDNEYWKNGKQYTPEHLKGVVLNKIEVHRDENGEKHFVNDHHAYTESNGTRHWYNHGVPHRDGDKPAVDNPVHGEQLWYKNGKLHRDGDKPAIERRDGSKQYWKNNERHRDGDKPAVIKADGSHQYWKNGKQYTPEHTNESVDEVTEGLWPGTPEYEAKFGKKTDAKGGAGVKKGTKYGGSNQPADDDEEEEKKASVKEDATEQKPTVSAQVAALLEAEGLSDDFKIQAITIFEAAVNDRVMQIKEELQEEYENQLDEAKAEMSNKIDGILTETAQQWAIDNKVAIETGFKAKLAESFMDGVVSLLKEHNIDIAEDAEDALEIALEQVAELEQKINESAGAQADLIREINSLKADAILESYRSEMADTAFDRFAQLTKNIEYVTEEQYKKQLDIVQKNFSTLTESQKPKQQEPSAAIVTEERVDAVDSRIAAYAAHFGSNKPR